MVDMLNRGADKSKSMNRVRDRCSFELETVMRNTMDEDRTNPCTRSFQGQNILILSLSLDDEMHRTRLVGHTRHEALNIKVVM